MRAAAVLVLLALASLARAQDAPPPDPPSWSFALSGAAYLLPDDPDFVQPTFKADHGRLHLEGRYSYEDRETASVFAGATFETGEKVAFAITPMVGGAFGRTDGFIPAVEMDLSAGIFEAYGEAEYLIDAHDSASSYFYMWSELSLRPVGWLRAGLVTQRTRVYRADREIERGLLLGLSAKHLDGTVYVFEPGGDDHFVVVSLTLSF